MQISLALRHSNIDRLIVATGIIPAVLFVLSALSLGNPPELAATMTPLGDGTQAVLWIVPASPGWDAGLRPGDVVRAVAVPPGSGAWAAFEIVTGEHPRQSALLKRAWSPGFDVIALALGIEFLLAGIVVFVWAADRRAARRFMLLAVVIAAAMVTGPAANLGHPWGTYVETVALMLVAPTFSEFFLTTPVPR